MIDSANVLVNTVSSHGDPGEPIGRVCALEKMRKLSHGKSWSWWPSTFNGSEVLLLLCCITCSKSSSLPSSFPNKTDWPCEWSHYYDRATLGKHAFVQLRVAHSHSMTWQTTIPVLFHHSQIILTDHVTCSRVDIWQFLSTSYTSWLANGTTFKYKINVH